MNKQSQWIEYLLVNSSLDVQCGMVVFGLEPELALTDLAHAANLEQKTPVINHFFLTKMAAIINENKIAQKKQQQIIIARQTAGIN